MQCNYGMQFEKKYKSSFWYFRHKS